VVCHPRQALQFVRYNPDERESGVSLAYTNFTLSIRPGIAEGADPKWEGADGDALTVRGKPAFYFYGCYTEKGWDKDCGGIQVLVWRENGYEIQMWGSFPNDIARSTLVAIAENLR
jgi:hypothetical protein